MNWMNTCQTLWFAVDPTNHVLIIHCWIIKKADLYKQVSCTANKTSGQKSLKARYVRPRGQS